MFNRENPTCSKIVPPHENIIFTKSNYRVIARDESPTQPISELSHNQYFGTPTERQSPPSEGNGGRPAYGGVSS